MIELPDFTNPFRHEKNFYLTSDIFRMSKMMFHYELYKLTVNVPSVIVECGVFKGASLVRFTTFRELLNKSASKKIRGFDAFGGFPNTNFQEDKKWREKFISDSGNEGIGVEQLLQVLKHKPIDNNVDLIKGEVCTTIPNYI